MEIIKTSEGNHVTLSVIGTINTETVPELSKALLALDYNGLDLTLDFAKTDYITSAGLRALLVARKKLTDQTMRILHANEEIVMIFSVTGFDSLIHIEEETAIGEEYRLGFSNLLRERLKTDRDHTAYVFRGRTYSWGDIDKMSQIIADDLAKAGVKKGSHVGICSPNAVNWVAAFYAIQKLGGIAVLINPGLRPGEVVKLAQLSDTPVICYSEIPGITTFEEYRDACVSGGCVRYVYNIGNTVDFTARYDEYEAIADLYAENYPADDASVVIFSSGSTGLPKAILSSSFNIMASVEPLIKEMRIHHDDVNLAFLPLFHIFGFATGISAAVLTGYRSVIPESKSPDMLIGLIDEYQCTIFNSVPTMMLAITQAKTFEPKKLASLRLSILGGSATTESQMRMLRQLMPNIHFGNIYGMSENAAVSLTKYEDSIEHITQTVGKPVPGLEMVIRDVETGRALSAGQSGEICIRSQSMVICYYRLAIEKQPVDEEGWLATGDLGVLDNEGYLHIVGRKKDLIISGGENISPGEIAEALMQFPQIADVKVLGVPHEIRGEVVAAAIKLKEGTAWNDDEARKKLSVNLAKYKIPSYFVIVESFPLLGSGKIDAITLKKQVIEKIGGKTQK